MRIVLREAVGEAIDQRFNRRMNHNKKLGSAVERCRRGESKNSDRSRKHLCEKGVGPDEITALFDWRPNRVWYTVDGAVDAKEFEKRAAEKVASGGPTFSRRRWFCDDDDLIQANGKTYAFSNQWGGENWHKAMALLKERYSQFNIDFSPQS